LDKLGMTSPDLTFHGFRHGFRDMCRDDGVPDDAARALGGWAPLSADARYGKRGRLTVLAKEAAKITLDGFRVSAVVAEVPPVKGYRVPKLKETPAHDQQDGPHKAVGGATKRGRKSSVKG
jgi:hypothetical protein